MKTILEFPVPICGDFRPLKEDAFRDINRKVQSHFYKLCGGLSEGRKWNDPDFGPSADDEYGKYAFYRTGQFKPPLPNPECCLWARPGYSSTKATQGSLVPTMESEEGFGEEQDFNFHVNVDDSCTGSFFLDHASSKTMTEVSSFGLNSRKTDCIKFCDEGNLFIDGSTSSDCIQGKVGNCWFIGALSVLATRDDLLKNVIWQSQDHNKVRKFEETGIYVVRFFKNAKWIYVFIDDRLPVFSNSLKPVFGHCENESELWVPLIEKAYAKLHKSYDSLTGGFIDTGLRELTGLSTERIVLAKFESQPNSTRRSMWYMLNEFINVWGSLIGCSIAPLRSKKHQNRPEMKIGNSGLLARHAYAIIDVGTIWSKSGSKIRLVRVRNPWGFGEWKGKWSDSSQEIKQNLKAIHREFGGALRNDAKFREHHPNLVSNALKCHEKEEVKVNDQDGTFFMSYADWKEHFTVLFIAHDFPTKFKTACFKASVDSEATSQIDFRINCNSSGEKVELKAFALQKDFRISHGKFQNRKQRGISIKIKQANQQEKNHTTRNISGNIGYEIHLGLGANYLLANGDYIFSVCHTGFDFNSEIFIQFFTSSSNAVNVIANEDSLLQDESMPMINDTLGTLNHNSKSLTSSSVRSSACKCHLNIGRIEAQNAQILKVLLLFSKYFDRKNNADLMPCLENSFKAKNDCVSFEGPQGDEFLAIKPWFGQIHAPTTTTQRESTSLKKFSMSKISGITNKFSKNIVSGQNGSFFFAAAKVCVQQVSSKSKIEQNYFEGCTDDITSIAYSSDLNILAAGQVGKKPKILVWNINSKLPTCQLVAGKVGFTALRAIGFLEFANHGELLLSLANDNDHTLTVFRGLDSGWTEVRCLGSMKTTKKNIRFLNVFKKRIYIGGEDCIFYGNANSISNNQSRVAEVKPIKKSVLKIKGKISFLSMTSLTGFDNNLVLTVTSESTLVLIDKATIIQQFTRNVNKLAITALASFVKKNRVFIICGNRAGEIYLLYMGKTAQEKNYFLKTVSQIVLSKRSRVLHIEKSLTQARIFVSTKKAQVYDLEITIQNGIIQFNQQNVKLLVSGHYKEELWGLTELNGSNVVTAGDDGILRVYESTRLTEKFESNFSNRIRSLATTPYRNIIVCGFGGRFGGKEVAKLKHSGVKIFEFQENKLKLLKTLSIKKAVRSLKISPCGLLIAIAVLNKLIVLRSETYTRYKLKSKSSSPITGIDFSEDSKIIRTNDESYEVLYYTRSSGGFLHNPKSKSFRDVTFANPECKFTWNTKGIWSDIADGTNINSVAVSPDNTLLAAATDFGDIRIYKYPCTEKQKFRTLTCHSSHVTKVYFSSCGSFLYSVGGFDRCLVKWQLDLD